MTLHTPATDLKSITFSRHAVTRVWGERTVRAITVYCNAALHLEPICRCSLTCGMSGSHTCAGNTGINT